MVETPQYSGTGSDGTRYVVSATEAHTPLGNTSVISMTDASLELARPGKAVFRASTRAATVDTIRQSVVAQGVTTIRSDDGMSGTLTNMQSDMRNETTSADGPVELVFPDGARLAASAMRYDGKADIWSFDRATLVVPSLPEPHTVWTDVYALFTQPGSFL